MNVLFIVEGIGGHNISYLRALSQTKLYKSVIITPVYISEIDAEQIVYDDIVFPNKSFIKYKKWIMFIINESKKKKYDVFHFIDGDTIMRFFGLGISKIVADKHLITFHHFFSGLIRKVSYKCMLKCGIQAVVHTDNIKKQLEKIINRNVNKVDYPSFTVTTPINKKANKIPILGAFGATRYEKGLDILLSALECVNNPFVLLIAGAETEIKKSYIDNFIPKIKGKVICDLKFLSEDELKNYLDKTDIFVLPYRLNFDGASGPLADGVARRKMIIGSNHGSLGELIEQNHIGVTFEAENIDSLAHIIEQAITEPFVYDETALAYSQKLTVENFIYTYYKIYTN